MREKMKIDHGKYISKYQKKLIKDVGKSHQDPMSVFQFTISSPGETTCSNLTKLQQSNLSTKDQTGGNPRLRENPPAKLASPP